ncbi:MAG: hypothetical protein JETCAE02_25040 [Anaerolineaceae bacterium]|nr:DUF4160 domain-containing protein [Anaerolineae bacterium]MBL1171610.1 DUF4160 domain-containing protein [Chloroflexota bacterium]MCL4823483.1 DUF4160 domain-containing protein [Anaerolineales bacterium]MDL1926336.1 DUF4160 domain-containing protein [Anaerolineae bacterium AMX1]GJQ40092.1 MAG: hypothetical protein JETCAE02_25040 [Anaerolineaceae bacterium]
MPIALRIGGYRFYFYSYDCVEPRHMHVDRGGMSAKFWLDPIALAENHGYSRKELRGIERIMVENLETLRNEWDAFCSGNVHSS